MKKVLVLGKGFIADHLDYEKYTKRIIPNVDDISESVINKYQPDVIINCIGKTGTPNVDQCESLKIETATSNISIPIAIASAAKIANIKLIHMGSGCIFYGKSPRTYKTGCISNPVVDPGWSETNHANPSSYYSKTKYAADLALSSFENVAILRLRMPISSKNHTRNLLNKLVNYRQVLEENNSVTFMDDLVNAINFVIEKDLTGIYHITSPTPIAHSMLLEEYKKYNTSHTYEKITKEQLNALTIAERSNCILDSSKIIKEGFVFGDTQTRIQECVKNFVEDK